MARKGGSEDNPMQRAIRQKDLVESVRHENEVLRLDLNRESREARKSNSSGAATDIGRFVSICVNVDDYIFNFSFCD